MHCTACVACRGAVAEPPPQFAGRQGRLAVDKARALQSAGTVVPQQFMVRCQQMDPR